MNLTEIRQMGIVEARKLPLETVLKAVYEGETYIANPYRHEDEHHNAIDQGWEVRNSYDGNLVSRHRIEWSYWRPGVVKDIDVREFYDDDSPKSVLITRQDKDGKEQPVVIERQAFAKQIAEPIGELNGG